MILEIIIAVIIGIIFGCISGLTPGIHVNLISTFLLALSPFLLQFTSPLILGCIIIVMAVTHTFLNSLPAIYLGAPDDSTILNVLPGHKYLLKGKAYEAVKLTVSGALFALIIAILLSPLLIKIIPIIYERIKEFIGYILLVACLFLIIREKKKFWALILFIIAGIFGLAVLNLNLKNPLFPLLTSMFGIAGLIISLKDKVQIPEQIITSPKIFTKETFKAISSGALVGTFTSMLPGIGPSESAIISSQLTKLKDSGFLTLVGSLDTLNMIISFITLFSINKARNGAVVIISRLLETITLKNLILFLSLTLISGIIAIFITLKLAKVFSSLITKINYQKLCICIIILLILITIWLSSWLGLLILVIGSFICILPPLLGIGRNHLMGCLLLPVILFFLL